MLAGQYYNAGAYVEARRLYTLLINSDSSDIASFLELAEIASFTQHYDEAVSNLEYILMLDSANLNSLMMLGDILSRKNDSSAIVYYERAFEIYPENQKVAYDVAIVVDCGDLNRIGKVQNLIQKDKALINIDHHITNDLFGSLNWVKPMASSTAEVTVAR